MMLKLKLMYDEINFQQKVIKNTPAFIRPSKFIIL